MFENITRKFYASPNVPSAQEPDPIDVAVRSSFKMNRIYPNSEQKDLSAVIVYNVSVEPGGPLFYDKDGTKPADADYIFELAIRNLLVIARSSHNDDMLYYFPIFIADSRASQGVLTITSRASNSFITFECAKGTTAEADEPDPQAPDDTPVVDPRT